MLSYQLNLSQEIHMLPGLKIVNNVRDINHAQFADDTLLLGGASVHSAEQFKKELDLYQKISGSKINFHKSKIFTWNCTARDLRNITKSLGMEGTKDWYNLTYLGIPIRKNKIKSADWEPIVDKIKSKIQNWGANWLNLAGKTILIKSVLNSMPIYQSSILLAPCSVVNKIEGLLKKFIWEGGKGNNKKIHLVSWEKIKKPRNEGSLHVRSLSSQNLALGAKLLWQLISRKNGWSKEVIRKKYYPGPRKRCLDLQPLPRKGSPIYKLCNKALGPFKHKLYWIPGNGKSINVWEDSILGDPPIGSHVEVSNIQRWLMDKGATSLWDISA